MRTFLLLAAVLCFGLLASPGVVCGRSASTDAFHGVVVHDLTIDGRVYIVSDRRDDKGHIPDPRPAAGVRVEIRSLAADKVVAEARTDAQGRYSIPRIDVGYYKVRIGLLHLDLEVRPAASSPEGAARAFVVLVPEELAPAER